MELDGSEEEFEDAQDSFPLDDDIMFGEESESRKMNPLSKAYSYLGCSMQERGTERSPEFCLFHFFIFS